MEELPQTSKGILKLKGTPQEVELSIDKTTKYKCWMHPLTCEEMLDVEAVEREAYRVSVERGFEKNDSDWRSSRVGQCQQLVYSLKKSDSINAERFLTDREAALLDYREVNRLTKLYDGFFVPTKDEIKNSLRERLGKESEILSTSPNDSAKESSSLTGHIKKTLTSLISSKQ